MAGTGPKAKRARKTPGKNSRPFGRDDVVAAVIDAAGELFARRGFDGVSIRDIAKKAGVNHGLIHRHFGSKENLHRQSLQHMADAMLADIKDAGAMDELALRAFELLEKHERFWRMLARAIMDGRSIGELHRRYPIAQYLIDQVTATMKEGSFRGGMDPRMIVAAMISFSHGFILFEPFIRAAVGLEGMRPDRVRDEIIGVAMSLLKGRQKPGIKG
jgi:TetR/AcrR family transcriptional regulator, repressor for neighboring sulfatase